MYIWIPRSGLPDFSWYNKPKRKNVPELPQKYQMATTYVHQNRNKIPNGHEIPQHFPFLSLPKCHRHFHFLYDTTYVGTIWQPWPR
jgi:hypothetical protein